ncbi:hypothetical protein MED121_03768 [Marinomonas sp. MED121]|uniref:tellurite resistance TerB family protein n=1 Tax=Marinomonas sp. MED121 TaxID=314277 RepID=UPI000068FA7D|nr:TerB family tellurite resistance protein [Marinomonas sp. MED121]EAQ63857.1 hypothetical protein MED121_03768 [Marinomonas sp. MED121]
MLAAFKKIIEQFQDPEETVEPVSYQQAVAALLIEVMLADEKIEETEKQQVLTLIEKETGLLQVEQLYLDMKQSVESANDMFQFTNAINDHAGKDEKEALVAALWRVAYADGVLDEYEDYRIRRICELLYVPHSVFIQSKLAAKAAKDAE